MDQEQEQVADEHLVHGGGEEYAANETTQFHRESSAIDQSKTKARVKLEQAQLKIQQLHGIHKDMEEYIVHWAKSTSLEQEKKTIVAIDGLSRLQNERTRIEDTLKDAINDRNHMEVSLGCVGKELKKVKEQKTEVTVSLEKVQRELEEVVKAKTEVEKELEYMRNRLEEFQIESTDIRRKLEEAQMQNAQILIAVTDSLRDATNVIKHYFLEEMNKLRNSCGVPSKGIENAYRRDSLVFYDNISDSISFQVTVILVGAICAGASPFLLLKSHHLAWRVAIGACLLFFIASGRAVYFR